MNYDLNNLQIADVIYGLIENEKYSNHDHSMRRAVRALACSYVDTNLDYVFEQATRKNKAALILAVNYIDMRYEQNVAKEIKEELFRTTKVSNELVCELNPISTRLPGREINAGVVAYRFRELVWDKKVQDKLFTETNWEVVYG